jgi:hypothetical protein
MGTRIEKNPEQLAQDQFRYDAKMAGLKQAKDQRTSREANLRQQSDAAKAAGVSPHLLPDIHTGMSVQDAADASRRINEAHQKQDPQGWNRMYNPSNQYGPLNNAAQPVPAQSSQSTQPSPFFQKPTVKVAPDYSAASNAWRAQHQGSDADRAIAASPSQPDVTGRHTARDWRQPSRDLLLNGTDAQVAEAMRKFGAPIRLVAQSPRASQPAQAIERAVEPPTVDQIYNANKTGQVLQTPYGAVGGGTPQGQPGRFGQAKPIYGDPNNPNVQTGIRHDQAFDLNGALTQLKRNHPNVFKDGTPENAAFVAHAKEHGPESAFNNANDIMGRLAGKNASINDTPRPIALAPPKPQTGDTLSGPSGNIKQPPTPESQPQYSTPSQKNSSWYNSSGFGQSNIREFFSKPIVEQKALPSPAQVVKMQAEQYAAQQRNKNSIPSPINQAQQAPKPEPARSFQANTFGFTTQQGPTSPNAKTPIEKNPGPLDTATQIPKYKNKGALEG